MYLHTKCADILYLLAGCPFRHADADNLRRKLQALEISKEGVSEVRKYEKM